MIDSKTLKEYIESLFAECRIPHKESIYIEMADNTIWTIQLFEKTDKSVEIRVNDIFLGTFVEIIQPSKNLYVAKFERMITNINKHKMYFLFIQKLCEPNNILCPKK